MPEAGSPKHLPFGHFGLLVSGLDTASSDLWQTLSFISCHQTVKLFEIHNSICKRKMCLGITIHFSFNEIIWLQGFRVPCWMRLFFISWITSTVRNSSYDWNRLRLTQANIYHWTKTRSVLYVLLVLSCECFSFIANRKSPGCECENIFEELFTRIIMGAIWCGTIHSSSRRRADEIYLFMYDSFALGLTQLNKAYNATTNMFIRLVAA